MTRGRRSPGYACSGGIGSRGRAGAAAGRVAADAAHAVRELPADQASWAFEPKWDGYRALGHVVGGGLALRSRNGVDMAGWFPELGGLTRALGGRGAVLDGEVVAFDDRGRPSFEALQQRMAGRAGRRRGAPVTYLVFDLLWLDGRLLTGLPYTERRRLLEDLAMAGDAWQTVGSFPGAGTALLAATAEQGLEGVVAKRLASTYQPGRRTRHWLKVKHYQRETFLVGGFVPDPGGQVRSLLVGLPDPEHKGRLRFAGRVEAGLVPAARRRVGDLLAPLATGRSPFAEPTGALFGGRWSRPGPDDPAPVFVRPEVAVEVTFLGWEGGRLRHPAYSGLAAAGR